MFRINDDLSIEITRGDVVEFTVTAQENGENHVFKTGDVVRFKVFEKKGCECVVLQKDFGVESDTEEVTIVLEEVDTKIGDLISKPKDYWYEVELNPDTLPCTIIGYDADGAKVFKLYPEGRDLGADPITPEDIPFVDKELDMTSTRPVENQAIVKKFATVEESVSKNATNIQAHTAEINNIKDTNATQANSINDNATAIQNHANNKENPHSVTATQVGAVPTSRTVNGKSLAGNITLSASDVGARPNTWMPTAENVGAVPTIRTVNGKALSEDIVLSSSDVGARPNTWTPTPADIGEHDYVVAQGTGNGWCWRKWASGLGECWGGITGTTASSALASRGYPFPFKDVFALQCTKLYTGDTYGYEYYLQPMNDVFHIYVRQAGDKSGAWVAEGTEISCQVYVCGTYA